MSILPQYDFGTQEKYLSISLILRSPEPPACDFNSHNILHAHMQKVTYDKIYQTNNSGNTIGLILE